ncbi:unnamed protein product [Caenorhabditis angaria]|uniref:SHSP domain-containing protein n=1 Tax=Caenorhabditis angaria TaxID=860376 RepID=A0A9P1MZX9_9PELO|nr:unnamed protein product [Caenorhabditis angaria]
MSVCPYANRFNAFLNDFNGLQRRALANTTNFNFANELGDIENNENQFAVDLDVRHFKPEELNVNLNGHVLTVEGNHEVKTEHGFVKRSFTRQFTLPKDADLAAIHSNLENNGHMRIQVPKIGATNNTTRSIPIQVKPSLTNGTH